MPPVVVHPKTECQLFKKAVQMAFCYVWAHQLKQWLEIHEKHVTRSLFWPLDSTKATSVRNF